MDFSRESILQQHLPPRAKHTLQSMGSSWQATSPLSRSQLYCCLLSHPWRIPVGTGSHTADERKGKRCNWVKTNDFFFFFNRSSFLQIYIVKSNSFQINWAQYLGMWLVYRATKHSVSLGTNELVLETNWVLPAPIIFSNIFLLPKCGTVDFVLLGKSYSASSLMSTIQSVDLEMSLHSTEKRIPWSSANCFILTRNQQR